MGARLSRAGGRGLEGLCDVRGRIRIGTGVEGVERLEAYFQGRAFAPHRHDTYAIGITRAGVQSFRYRGALRHCLPGQCHILHPDEPHDGAAGTDAGFGYGIVYIDPALIREATGTLPFVADPVIEATALSEELVSFLGDIDSDMDALARTDIALAAADQLLALSAGRPEKIPPLSLASLRRVRELIAASPARRHAMVELERIADLDRWTLARQFRLAFGTSPSRYRRMRQLDALRALIQAGTPLAEAASAAGFADQSHMSRCFKSAYGLTPGHWVRAVGRKEGGRLPSRG
jgi:AraC-like DNA-binding protein